MNGTTRKDDIWEQYHERIDENFKKTGKREAIIESTRQQLFDSDWSDDVQDKFVKFVRNKVSFNYALIFLHRVGKSLK